MCLYGSHLISVGALADTQVFMHLLSFSWPIALAAATGHAGGVLAPGLGAVGGLWLFVRCGFAAAGCAVLFAALGDRAARSRHGGALALAMLGMALLWFALSDPRENWGRFDRSLKFALAVPLPAVHRGLSPRARALFWGL